MIKSLTYLMPATSPKGGYPLAGNADYGYGMGMFKLKT